MTAAMTVGRIRSTRPSARSRLIIRTSPVLPPSSANRLMIVKTAIATITGPARVAPSSLVSTTSRTKFADAVDDGADEVEGATTARRPGRAPGSRARRRSPSPASRSVASVFTARSDTAGAHRSPSRAWCARSSRSSTSARCSAMTRRPLVGRDARAARGRAARPRPRGSSAELGRLVAQDAVAEVEELQQVEAERHIGRAVRPVPRVEPAVRLAEVPLDPVAVPAPERELERRRARVATVSRCSPSRGRPSPVAISLRRDRVRPVRRSRRPAGASGGTVERGDVEQRLDRREL